VDGVTPSEGFAERAGADALDQLVRSERDGLRAARQIPAKDPSRRSLLGGCDGLISTALGRLRDGWRSRSITTSATSQAPASTPCLARRRHARTPS
jgi:hypothetical protein